MFPQRLQVAQSTAGPAEVDVSARYRKKKSGEILSDRISWHANVPGLQIIPTPSGRDARLKIPRDATGQFTIKVYAGSQSDELVIDIVAPAGDQALAVEHTTPSIVLLGGTAGDCPDEITVAFVRSGALASRDAGCTTSDVVRFTAYAAPKRSPFTWTTGSETVDFPTAAAPLAAPIRVWLLFNLDLFQRSGITATAAETILNDRGLDVDNSIGLANGIFYASRVGVRVDRVGTPTTILSTATNCQELLAQLELDDDRAGGAGAPDIWHPTAINVYVMDAFTGARGQFCMPKDPAEPKNVLRLQTNALRSTLTHEIGHLWGLYVPWGPTGRHTGHVDKIRAFAQDNVMWGYLNLGTTAARTRFSLGQVYRMHFDRRSFLAAGSTLDCGCDPFATTCTRLSQDVRPLALADGALGASANFCQAPYP